jgi:hypothetical protein
MLEAHRVVLPLRVFLVLLFGVLVVFQNLSLPGQFVVMRALLLKATTLRTDMEAVI